ncbi:hypothetical protein AUJ61_01405 [Candidatus Pacearchaeota archaeon CG1_02_30_18]|nr:MAG: hypothetical protein AUJ61_01405 [Candidatus Pacearchaeota archaeon CG1_02_30_18]
MVLKSKENSIGAWAFFIGVVLAIIIGIGTTSILPISKLTQYSSPIYGILVLLGLVIGFSINVSERDSQAFLLTGAVLVLVSKFGMESVTGSLIGIGIGDTVASTFSALLTLFVPATIVVAIKTVFSLSRI